MQKINVSFCLLLSNNTQVPLLFELLILYLPLVMQFSLSGIFFVLSVNPASVQFQFPS